VAKQKRWSHANDSCQSMFCNQYSRPGLRDCIGAKDPTSINLENLNSFKVSSTMEGFGTKHTGITALLTRRSWREGDRDTEFTPAPFQDSGDFMRQPAARLYQKRDNARRRDIAVSGHFLGSEPIVTPVKAGFPLRTVARTPDITGTIEYLNPAKGLVQLSSHSSE
jgi:hypothetical protein